MSEDIVGKGETEKLVDEIDVIRNDLADTIDELIDRVSPKSVARRSVNGAKAKFVDETGSPRLETIIPVVAATVGTIAAIIVIRRLLS